MISIVIPVYNAERFLRRCLDSVINQSYCHWEALCVNDGSTDDSELILKEYSEKDSRIRVFSQKNGGASVARNTGLHVAKGDYVYFLDSDDKLCPDCLSLLWEEITRHPSVEMVIGAHETVESDGSSRIINYGEPGFIEGNEWVRFHAFKDHNSFYVVPWNKLIKKTFLLDNGLFFKEGVIHEDDHWSFFLYKALTKVSILNDITYRHIYASTSVMSTRTSQKSVESLYLILKDIVKEFDSPLRSLQVYKYLEYFRNHVYLGLPKKRTISLYFVFFKELLWMKQFKIAALWLINWFRGFKHSQLYYQLIPMAYRNEVFKCLSRLESIAD